MTDNRIEKIRVIIQHFVDRGTEEYKESIDRDVNTDADYWHGYADCANALLFKIDSLQEEPKFSVGDKIRRKDDHDMTIEIKELKDGCYVEGGEDE